MNDYYSYERKLNIKKVIIAIAILLAIVIVIIVAITSKNNDKNNTTLSPTTQSTVSNKAPSKKQEELSTNVIFQDKDKSISVELKRSYGLEQVEPQDNRLLILQSQDNLTLYAFYHLISANFKS